MAKRKSLKERMANVLSASDVNYLKNNGDKHPLGYLIQKLGKSGNLIVKELKKLQISPLNPADFQAVEVPILDKVPTPKFKTNPVSNPIELIIDESQSPNPLLVTEPVRIDDTIFTEKEIEFIKENYHSMYLAQIAKTLNQTKYKVLLQVKKLGLHEIKPKDFSAEEMDFIRKNAKNFFLIEIAQKLNKSEYLVRKFYRQEGLVSKKPYRLDFSQEELDFMQENRTILTRREIAQKLNRKYVEVRYLMDKNRWVLTPEETKALKSRWSRECRWPNNIWSAVEEAFVNYNFGKLTYKQMSEILKTKTREQIVTYCKNKGMRVSVASMSKFNAQNSIIANEVLRQKRASAK
jgi:hypothetical protein